MSKKIGFVIVNYNDSERTIKLINNIKEYKSINKIVIVDNNSSDNSKEILSKYENDKIKLIINSNRHYSSGLNAGAKYIIKELKDANIVFSNSDIIIDKEKDIIDLCNNIKDDVVVVGPTVDEHGIINRGWKLPSTNHEILNNLILISRIFRKKLLYKEEYYKDNTSIVDVVSGCFFIVDSSFLKKVDYFDENTFLYYEEQILACKVKKENKKELIDNKVTIKHDHSVSIDKSIKRVKKHNIMKTSQRYFCKNYLKANFLQMFLLWLTDKFFMIFLYIRSLFRI